MATQSSGVLSALHDGTLSYQPVWGSKFRHIARPDDSLTLCLYVIDANPSPRWADKPTCRRCVSVWKAQQNG